MSEARNIRNFPPVPAANNGGNNGMPPGGPPVDLLERVIKIEAAIPNLATKTEVAELRSEMHQEFAKMRQEMQLEFAKVYLELAKMRQDMHQEFAKMHQYMVTLTWRFIGFSTSIAMALVAATYFISQHAAK